MRIRSAHAGDAPEAVAEITGADAAGTDYPCRLPASHIHRLAIADRPPVSTGTAEGIGRRSTALTRPETAPVETYATDARRIERSGPRQDRPAALPQHLPADPDFATGLPARLGNAPCKMRPPVAMPARTVVSAAETAVAQLLHQCPIRITCTEFGIGCNCIGCVSNRESRYRHQDGSGKNERLPVHEQIPPFLQFKHPPRPRMGILVSIILNPC